MALLMLLLCMIGQPPDGENVSFTPGIRLGGSFMASFPSMQAEKDFAEMTSNAGLSFDLGSVAWGWSLEILGDINEKFKVRGSIGASHLRGAHTDGYNALQNVIMELFTLGLWSSSAEEDVIELTDAAITFEVQGYYVLTRTPGMSVSAGAGPVYAAVSRTLETPYTSTSGDGSGLGFVASLRLDQESSFKLGCLPLLLGFEAGYRMVKVDIGDDEVDEYELDFSGPFFKVAYYIGL